MGVALSLTGYLGMVRLDAAEGTLRDRFVAQTVGWFLLAFAGFLVVLTGDILRMPGLPAKPRAEAIDLVDGEIVGLIT